MPSKIHSASVFGFDCKLVEVETDILNGASSFIIVGLGDASVQESKERIRSAIKNSGFDYPRRKKIVNLAPADLRKHGPAFDLPIALGLLMQSGQISKNCLDRAAALGELSLNGEIRKIAGVLPIAAFLKQKGFKTLIAPVENAEEAAIVSDISVIAAQNLSSLVAHLRGETIIPAYVPAREHQTINEPMWRFEDIRGHECVKRALIIAAAGEHNIALSGPPGSGKTVLARSLQSILPSLNFEDSLEVTKIYSIAGKLAAGEALMHTPPFRAVHHTASDIALTGGGGIPRPGEISFAHRGVLFLDEFLQFQPSAINCLRQPLEDGMINISRAAGSAVFPAKFILVAAMNPCSCGFYGDPKQPCMCKPDQVRRYRKRLSGALLDRIDLMCSVPRLSFEKITSLAGAESSETVRKKIMRARHVQHERYLKEFSAGGLTNGRLSSAQTRKSCELNIQAFKLMKEAYTKFNYSGRAYYRLLKVSRTIADLEDLPEIAPHHLAEALQYRTRMGEDKF